MTAKPRNALTAMLFASVVAGPPGTLCGCELVAGIRDLRLTTQYGVDAGNGDLGPPDATFPASLASEGGTSQSADEAAPAPMDGAAPEEGVTPEAASDSDGPSDSDGGLATELIDDMEGQTQWILVANGRNGPWFTYNDGTDGGLESPASTAMPPLMDALLSPSRGASRYAARVSASGFQSYVGMGFDLNDQAGTPATYDASAYQGVTFWGRVSSGSLSIRFSLSDIHTAAPGGVCTMCGDYFGKNLTLTTSWTQFFVFYADLAQVGWGAPPVGAPAGSPPGAPGALAASAVYGCQFQVSSNPAAFELWIDDVAFIKR